MNKYILKTVFKNFLSNETQLFITSLTYYVIVAFIPCFALCNYILKIIGLSPDNSVAISLDLKGFSPLLTLSVLLFSLALICRFFYAILTKKANYKHRILLSFFFGVLSIIFLLIFILIFTLKNSLIRCIVAYIFTLIILAFLNGIFGKNFSLYSLLFSSIFSLIMMAFLSFFGIISEQFLHYENYYGVLAPLFLFILEVNLLINLAYLNYLFSSLYTKFSKIKIVKL